MAQTKIAGLFLDPTVISGLTAITDGASNADYLFVWDAGTSTLKKILPDNLGLAAAAHTIESHTATSATGANLETLTNAGDADALHTHALKAPLAGPTFTGTTTFATLSDGTIGITAFLDADNMSGASATTLSTSESIKAYVDAAGGTTINGTTDNAIITYINSSGQFQAEANLKFDGTNFGIGSGMSLNHAFVMHQTGTDDEDGMTFQNSANNHHMRIKLDSSNAFVMSNGGNGGITIDTAGNVKVSNGNLVIGTNGKGIDFSITTDSSGSSTDSELLNDYEEGHWVPSLSDGTNTATGQIVDGHYTKIGRMVNIQAYVKIINLGSVSGAIRINSLPFTTSSHGNLMPISVTNASDMNISAGQVIVGATVAGQSYLNIQLWDTALGDTPMQASEWTGSGQMTFGGWYMST